MGSIWVIMFWRNETVVLWLKSSWSNYNKQSSFIWMKPLGMFAGEIYWLWVAITKATAVFHIGSRKKEELSYLVRDAMVGWLITDGYCANTARLGSFVLW